MYNKNRKTIDAPKSQKKILSWAVVKPVLFELPQRDVAKSDFNTLYSMMWMWSRFDEFYTDYCVRGFLFYKDSKGFYIQVYSTGRHQISLFSLVLFFFFFKQILLCIPIFICRRVATNFGSSKILLGLHSES